MSPFLWSEQIVGKRILEVEVNTATVHVDGLVDLATITLDDGTVLDCHHALVSLIPPPTPARKTDA